MGLLGNERARMPVDGGVGPEVRFLRLVAGEDAHHPRTELLEDLNPRFGFLVLDGIS